MSYADLNGQRTMAFDNVRNEFYEAAIRKVVTPDSVVLDLGSGLGIHALMAARAGARRVFMVEPENVIHCAMEVARHNGYGDRIEAFQGRIEEVELPEKVDVIISVFTGNLLYSEDLLPSLYHARDKWLKRGGALIPDAAELMMAPVAMPKLIAEHVAVWSELHGGFDYSPLRRYAANSLLSDRSKDARGELFATGQVMASANFHIASETNIDSKVTFDIDRDGICDGLHAWIRILVGKEWLASGPIEAPMHWTPQTFALDPPIVLQRGQVLDAALRRRAFGEWTWKARSKGQEAKGSTFLATPLLSSRIKSSSDLVTQTLSQKGFAAKLVIDSFDKRMSNFAISAALRIQYPVLFPTAEEAARFAYDIACRYCE